MNTKPTPKKYVALAPRADHRTPPERSATEGGVRQIRTAPRRAHPADRQRSALLRSELGGVLRQTRHRQCMTLRDVSESARVSLGYLSEVERGHKEASSELLASICEALDVPLWLTLYEVADRLAAAEGESVEGYHAARRLSLVR
ncbi:MAG: helix-turn-helix domain-containing protein [Bifidobacteriaceae bacterium]|nr:helix-turn-helix domain-containing protein [Bifidobacteriaceae bacterium]